MALAACSSRAAANIKNTQSDNSPVPSLEVKIASILSFEGQRIDDSHHIKEYKLGGVILFDCLKGNEKRNMRNSHELKKLTTDLQKLSASKLLIAVDQEGGRIGGHFGTRRL